MISLRASILVLLVVALARPAAGQGTIYKCDGGGAGGTFTAINYYTPPGFTQKAFVLDITGLPLDWHVGRVEILNAEDGGATIFSPGGAAGVPFSLDGIFALGEMCYFTKTGGESGTLFVRAWDSSTGATWDEATKRGQSLVNIFPLGSGLGPPASFQNDSDFVGMQLALVPEPATMALAVLGFMGVAVAGATKRVRRLR